LDHVIDPGYRVAADLTSLGEALRRVTVEIAAGRDNQASGVLWPEDGLVVTNAHVARLNRLTVRLWDGRESGAALIARTVRHDLALIRVPWQDLETARLGQSERLRVGDLVFAVGAPWGIPQSLTMGMVHCGPASVRSRNWIHAQLRLAPGNSGGPMANADGAVIGINTAIVGGLAVAIAIDRVSRFVRWAERHRVAA